MARPRKDVDEELVFKLARVGATTEQIARANSVSVDTIDRRYAEELRKIRAELTYDLLSKQLELAKAGDKTMLIWLGKQHLGQREPSNFSVHVSSSLPAQKPIPVEAAVLPTDQLLLQRDTPKPARLKPTS